MSILITVLQNDFFSIADRFGNGIMEVMANGAMNIIAAADPRTPVDTGALKGNKTVDVSTTGLTVGWNEDYAGYQELGTRHVAPKHFASGAMDQVGPSILQELASVLGGR